MTYTRRDLGKIALASLPAIKLFGGVNSKFGGVQIGDITYSFRTIPDLDEVIKMMADIGLGEAELMSDHAERFAGAPLPAGRGGQGGAGAGAGAGGRGEMTPEQREAFRATQQTAQRARPEELRQWRTP